MVALSISRWQEKGWASFFLVAMLFAIPLSPSLKSIFLVLSVLGVLVTFTHKQDFAFVFSQAWCKAAILLFLVTIAACLWGEADSHTRFVLIEKYSKLLYLPIFAVGFCNRKIRMMGIYAYLSAMVLTCVISVLKSKGYLNFHSEDPGHVFHNHIVTGFMMAFAAYLAGWLAGREQGGRRVLFLLLTLLFSYDVLFINTGRMSYVIYFILMLGLLMHYLPVKYLIGGVVGFCVLFGVFVNQSKVIHQGTYSILDELHQYQQGNKDSSVGYRLRFHQYAKSLFLSSPLIGQGTGGFSHGFKKDDPVPSWSNKNLLDPHSQYWLIAVEFGLLGIAALFYFFANLLFAAFRLQEMKPVMLGLLSAFMVGNLSDSLLLYSVVGYLFIVFSGLCLSESVAKQHEK
ncbi:O-antigen ligase family protein [Legionella oakridgensis]|uniref:Lipid A core-O-antigen ligase-related enzyme n=2 Tax=Legionella oakridgensis TaxID=29423 RepID=W0BC82_9GAMM|nr:O-antigen ligase family protein [Legionella oakridgensis]AHE66237.1 lipid A core - O-antigen ligase-related enzyme [Legionella oakridgensis ATCC 33761 = DSM 21215]ETO93954.1 lipid A core - O-antigen ligase [Legionella oakridgensis RV-2-2007]KTD44767.1 O-antigen biosynthesis protein [Legionella oakridgensis]STY16139.1 O-antigen biosynthesis protein [Legionella longbeachae]